MADTRGRADYVHKYVLSATYREAPDTAHRCAAGDAHLHVRLRWHRRAHMYMYSAMYMFVYRMAAPVSYTHLTLPTILLV